MLNVARLPSPFIIRARGGFDPRSLFSSSLGVLLDPSVGVYQDSGATSPVTTAGQSVAVIKDQTGNSFNFTQATALARPTWQLDGANPYLSFDGVDDWMAVTSVGLIEPGRTIIAGVRKNSDANIGSVFESRPIWTSATGGLAHFAPGGSAAATYGARCFTSTVQSILNSPASYAAPHTAVMTSTIAASDHRLRINGVEVVTGAPAGSLTAHSAGATIGARDGSSLFFAGRMYGLIVIDRVLSGAELANAEAWMAARCGVTI